VALGAFLHPAVSVAARSTGRMNWTSRSFGISMSLNSRGRVPSTPAVTKSAYVPGTHALRKKSCELPDGTV
jgi:hypothetical protein